MRLAGPACRPGKQLLACPLVGAGIDDLVDPSAEGRRYDRRQAGPRPVSDIDGVVVDTSSASRGSDSCVHRAHDPGAYLSRIPADHEGSRSGRAMTAATLSSPF